MIPTAPARRVALADPTDPLFRGLPFDDGTPHYLAVEVRDEEAVRLVLGFLRSRGTWRTHRIGPAVYGHCANGSRWIIGLVVDGDRPGWLDRLQARHAHARARTAPPGATSRAEAKP